MEGFQLWLNLPASDKMREPWYRDFEAAELPRFRTAAGVLVTVIAGTSHGIAGAVQRSRTEPLYLDIELPAGATFEQCLSDRHNAFVYVYRGEAEIGGQRLPSGRMAILANDAGSDGVIVSSASGARLLLIAGCPLGEPIAQYGPFVMNTEQQIHQAIADFRAGRLA